MTNRNSPPLEAVLLPDVKPRKSWVPFIMGSILVGSVLLAIVFGMWGLVKLVESIDRPGAFVGMSGSSNWPSPHEEQAEYRAVFRLPIPPVQDADLPQIEKFLNKYVTAAKYHDQGGLARLVDVDAFLARMQEHPDMPRLDIIGRKALIDELNKNLQLPSEVTDFHLMGFQRLAKSGSAMVDVIFKQAQGTSEPCRLWLQQNERAWSVVDWEIIQQGKSQAAQWAGAQRTAQDYLGSLYDSSINDMNNADDCYSKGDTRGAIRLLQGAQQRSLPTYMQKEMKLSMATRYYQYRQYQLAIDCLGPIYDPDEVPGYYVIRALSFQALGEAAKAIEAAANYERLCGFSPDVVRAKAQALAQLDKKAEAIVELKRLLEFDPSDQAALQQLVRLLPAGQKGQIADLIARTKNPPESALALAYSFLILEDEETTQSIQGLLEKKFSTSPATHAFVARLHQHQEEFDQAAAAFRRAHAAEADADKKQQRWHDYVSAMHSAGKLLQAYEESPNPVETFYHLTSGLSADESVVGIQDLPPLLEAHRRRAPQDPQLDYCTGLLAQHRDDLVAAEAAFAAGEAKATDESLKEELQYARLDVLADQGKILDAYREYESLENVFQTLAARALSQHKPDVLEELLRVHRKDHPKDPEVTYYAIALVIERGNYWQALQSLHMEREDGEHDDVLKSRLVGLEVDAYEKYDQWEQALGQDIASDEVLPRLATRFEQRGAWDKLRKLLAMGRMRNSPNSQYVLHDMKLAWQFADYGRIEQLVPRWYPAVWEKVPPHEQKWARETVVRSLLRQGNTSAAYAFAEQFQRDFQEAFPLLMVRIAQGETGGVKELLQRERYRVQGLEQDPELLPLLTDPRFTDLRRDAPLELPSGGPRTSLVLFLRQPLALDEAKLRTLLAGKRDFQVKVLSPTPQRPRQTLAVTHTGGTIFLTSGNSPYHLQPGDLELIRSSRSLANVSGQAIVSDLKMHQAWLALELVDYPAALTGSGPREDRLAKSLVQKLCGDNLLAIALDEKSTPTTLLPGNLLRAESLAPERSWKESLSAGSQLWLSLGSAGPESEVKTPFGRKAQREFAAAVAKLPAGQFAQVRVELTLGHASEEIWLKVARLERYDYGGYHLACELPADSQLYPHWKAGELCNVSFWQVRQARLPSP